MISGLALNTTMALLTSSQIARSRLLRRVLGGLTAVALPLSMMLVFADVRVTPLMITGLVVSAGSVAWATYVLWPRNGGFAAWRTMQLTVKQRRALLASLALVHLGFAVFVASAFHLTRGPWDATAVAVLTIISFVGAAVTLLVLGWRLRA